MEIYQNFGIFIAVISLGLSIYVMNKDQKNKKIELLFASRQRIFNISESGDVLTPNQLQEFFEEDQNSEQAQKERVISEHIQSGIDREFEFLCYLVIKNEVPFQMFLDLFQKYLAFRFVLWQDIQKHKISNYPYTWMVIQECVKRGKISSNKK